MLSIETLTVSEINAKLARLRARRLALTASGNTTERKVATLMRRRERLMHKVGALDEQIAELRGALPTVPPAKTTTHRTRRRRTAVTNCLDEILACVQRHTVTQRATIVEECHLSPPNATVYLRQLCQEGKLIRHGEKRATTYALPR